ncbi:MAG: hypothetical protein ACXVY8_08065 [Gaiellaceae bacterium]
MLSHRHALDSGLVVPRPLRAALPLLGLAALTLVLWAGGLEGPIAAGAVAGAIAAAAILRLALARRELARMRRVAAAQLRTHRYPPETELVGWRRGELTGRRKRKLLVRSLESITRDLSEKRLPGASPLNRVAARRYADLFPVLAERLRSAEPPATAVLMVEDLLYHPDSPLYARERSGELGLAITRCLAALAGDSRPVPGMPPRSAAPSR